MENTPFFTGVIDDPRTDPRVQNGHSIDEILAASAPLNWARKGMSELVAYPIWNQNQTSACVAFSKAKQISIKIYDLTGVWIDFSPASIYQLRSNRPGEGMNIADANDIVNHSGATLEALMKSQNMTEAQINSVKRTKVADLFAKAIAEAVVQYLYVPVDIDRIAQTIESKKAVSLLIFATNEEYSRMTPVIIDKDLDYWQAPIRHEVIGVDYFLDENSTQKVYINDSAHFGGLPVREFTKEFLEKRCILADAIDVFTFEPGEGEKPRYDGSVISLQKCLRFEGLFPSNVDFVENYGPQTSKAVSAFQRKYGLDPVGTGKIGPKTSALLYKLYS